MALYYPQANQKRPLILVGPPSIGRHELRLHLLEDKNRFAAAVPRKFLFSFYYKVPWELLLYRWRPSSLLIHFFPPPRWFVDRKWEDGELSLMFQRLLDQISEFFSCPPKIDGESLLRIAWEAWEAVKGKRERQYCVEIKDDVNELIVFSFWKRNRVFYPFLCMQSF